MATSSITEKIRVNNPKVIEEYIAATESAAGGSAEKPVQQRAETITDPAELRKIMLKGIEKSEKK